VAEIDFVVPQLRNHLFQQEDLSSGHYKIFSKSIPEQGLHKNGLQFLLTTLIPWKQPKYHWPSFRPPWNKIFVEVSITTGNILFFWKIMAKNKILKY
jgi:hypothetical protein